MLLTGLVGCPGSMPSTGGTPPSNRNVDDPVQPDAPASLAVPSAPESSLLALTVARHVEQPFSGAEVDQVFTRASRLLQTVQNECPDVATDVTFTRSGPVETFDEVPMVITTEADLSAVFAQPQEVKIVHALVGVCGVELPADVVTILGCATPGGSMVIVAGAPPDVWAHEWGHVQGLGHRDDCRSNIMHSFELDTNAVDQHESRAFLTPISDSMTYRAMGPETPVAAADHLMRDAGETAEVWLERVLERRYLTGVPRQLAADCDAEAISHLMEWCSEPMIPGARRNLIRLLGLAGDARICDMLIEQVYDHSGELSGDEFNVVAEAFLALGRLVEHDASGSAVDFLIEGTAPCTWDERGVEWRLASYDGAKLHALLARLSVLALGVSNSETALAHVRELRGRIDVGALSADDFADQVDEALARLEGRVAPAVLKSASPRMP